MTRLPLPSGTLHRHTHTFLYDQQVGSEHRRMSDNELADGRLQARIRQLPHADLVRLAMFSINASAQNVSRVRGLDIVRGGRYLSGYVR